MQELAREAILSNQLLLAHRTLEEASTAALSEQNSLRHDQLIIEIITTTGLLSETLIREGKTQSTMLESQEGRREPLPTRLNPKLSIRLARLEWQRARVLARNIINPTYRSEYLARVAEGLGRDSSRVVLEYVRRSDLDSSLQAEKLTEAEIKEVETSADDYLVEAEQVCREIDRPIWKNTALERTAINAGESQQYPRAFSIARSIQNAEARSQALILVAESQCRHRQAVEATKTYAEVAEAVARVDLDGLRGVLTGYLVDSLISTGRFEDARAAWCFTPWNPRGLWRWARLPNPRPGGAPRAGPPVDRQRCAPAWRPARLPPRQQRGTCQDRQLAAESLLGPGGAAAAPPPQ